MRFLGAISQALLFVRENYVVKERSFSCPSRVYEPPNSMKLLENNARTTRAYRIRRDRKLTIRT